MENKLLDEIKKETIENNKIVVEVGDRLEDPDGEFEIIEIEGK